MPLLLLRFCLSWLFASASVQVAGGSGSAARLQAAIDACPDPGACTIQLPDPVYQMERQVWLVGRQDIELVGTGANRPVLVWEDSLLSTDNHGNARLFQLTPPPGPGRPSLPPGWLMWPTAFKGGVGTLDDSTNTYSVNGCRHNGMFVAKSCARIGFRHLDLNGQKSAVFVNSKVWSGQYDIFQGSVGIALLQSLAVDVTDCEVRGFWSAIYSNGRNTSCQAWTNAKVASDTAYKPWTNCGAVGGHLIEKNRIHGNWWAVYSESEWDQGSVIRDNLAWDNTIQARVHPSLCVIPLTWASSSEAKSAGFLRVKDVATPIHVISNNTILDAPYPYDNTSFMLTGMSTWSDNLIRAADTAFTQISNVELGHWLLKNTAHLWNNTILHTGLGWTDTIKSIHVQDPTIPAFKLTVVDSHLVIVDDSTRYMQYTYDTTHAPGRCDPGCDLALIQPQVHTRGWRGLPWEASAYPGALWNAKVLLWDGSSKTYALTDSIEADSAGLVLFPYQNLYEGLRRKNWHCRNCPFASEDPTSTSFLVPAWNAPWVDSSIRRRGSNGKAIGAMGEDGRLGSQTPVRVRPTGMGRYDAASKKLYLPLSIQTGSRTVDKLVATRIRVTGFPVDTTGHVLDMTQSEILAGVLPEIHPTDSEFAVPLSGTSTYMQIEVWLAGVSGADTLATTPVAWGWTSRAKAQSFTTSAHFGPATSQIMVRAIHRPDGAILRVAGARAPGFVTLRDLGGRMRQFPTRKSGDGYEVRLGELPKGTWFANIDGKTVPVLIGP